MGGSGAPILGPIWFPNQASLWASYRDLFRELFGAAWEGANFDFGLFRAARIGPSPQKYMLHGKEPKFWYLENGGPRRGPDSASK